MTHSVKICVYCNFLFDLCNVKSTQHPTVIYRLMVVSYIRDVGLVYHSRASGVYSTQFTRSIFAVFNTQIQSLLVDIVCDDVAATEHAVGL